MSGDSDDNPKETMIQPATITADTGALAPGASADDDDAEAVVVAFPSGRYAIPVDEMGDFLKLGRKEQYRIKMLLTCFREMEADAAGSVKAAETLAFKLRHLRGFGASNLQQLFRKWKGNGWRTLVRGYTNGGEKLPPAFVDHFRAMTENNGRSIQQAINTIKRDWMSGEKVPGFGTWHDWFFKQWPERDAPTICPGFPTGWGKSNLYALRPSKASRKLKSRGFGAAQGLLPSMVRTTANLMPLQLIAIDDFEADHLCVYTDPATHKRTLVKMVGIAAMDVATRRIVGLVLKPRLENEHGREQAITRAEVRLLLFNLLSEHGVPSCGMTILAENAAAAVTSELQTTLGNLFGGRVAVTRTGLIHDRVAKGGFIERGGKPWLKGWIESAFNLLHNIAEPLPGYKGRNYLEKPGDFEESKRVTERLIGQGPRDARLSPEQLEKARLPFLSSDELAGAYMRVFDIMETRTAHRMEGFDKVMEWRRDEGEAWQPFVELAALPEAEQVAVILNERMQSPRERWLALRDKVTCKPVSEAALALLLLTPKTAKIAKHKLTFSHNGQGYTFAERGTFLDKAQEGEKVLVYFDAANADRAHVCRQDGRYIGAVRRLGAVDILDKDAVNEAERTLAAIRNGVLADVRARPLHKAEAQQLAADATHNAKLIEQAAEGRNLIDSLTRDIEPGTGDKATADTALGKATSNAILSEEQKAKADVIEAKRRANLKRGGRDIAAAAELLDEPADDSDEDAPDADFENPHADLLG